jgi:hypothetical protein
VTRKGEGQWSVISGQQKQKRRGEILRRRKAPPQNDNRWCVARIDRAGIKNSDEWREKTKVSGQWSASKGNRADGDGDGRMKAGPQVSPANGAGRDLSYKGGAKARPYRRARNEFNSAITTANIAQRKE